MLSIEYQEDLVPATGCQVYSKTCNFLKCESKEAAGHEFHRLCLLQRGLLVESDCNETSIVSDSDAGDDGATDTNPAEDATPDGVRWRQERRNRRTARGKQGEAKAKAKDLYALLGLQDIRWAATAAEVRRAYQKTALKHHPDKAAAGVEDPVQRARLEDYFKLVQEAFETLSDPGKRREYDSTDAVDDALPESCRPEDFYAVFGAAFRRQARWSERRPVPELGGPDATEAAIRSFYDFWFKFKSWREFPHEDEEDPECAECREERRWIERENARLRARAKKDETRRLREFVERAHVLDPRIVAKKAAEKAGRERRRLEKELAREAAAAADAAAAAAAAEREARVAEAAKAEADIAKKARAAEQRELRRQRKRLRDATRGCKDYDPHVVEEVAQALEREALASLCDRLEGVEGDERSQVVAQARRALAANRDEEAAGRGRARAVAAAEAARQKQREAEAQAQAAAADWSPEEVRLLDKALTKFPVGVPRRWEQITAYIRTRTQEEVRQGAHSSKFQQSDWRAGRKGGAAAHVGIDSKPDDRGTAFTDVKLAAFDAAAPKVSSDATLMPSAGVPATNGVNGNGGAPGVEGDWTKVQEVALIKAIKAVKKDADDRWGAIAEQVPGKDKLQCAKHFKSMKALAKSG